MIEKLKWKIKLFVTMLKNEYRENRLKKLLAMGTKRKVTRTSEINHI